MSDARTATCRTCPRSCRIPEGSVGFCRARRNVDGTIVAGNYGRVTSLAVDPIVNNALERLSTGLKFI